MKKGFTLIETIVVLAIFSLLLYLATVAYTRIQQANLLTDHLEQVASVLYQAQSNASSGQASGDDYYSFGMVFTESSFLEFTTLSDFTNRDHSQDLETNLASSLSFSSISLPDNCINTNDCIIFSPIEGTPSAAGSLKLENPKSGESRTVIINQTGKVEY